jgi:hypothetical protein
MTALFSARTTNGTGTEAQLVSRVGEIPTGFVVSGTPDGASITFQVSMDNVTYVTLARDLQGNALTVTAAGAFSVYLPFKFIRAVLASAGAGTNMSVTIR